MLCRSGPMGSGGLVVEVDEILDAQAVNVGIVCDALQSEMLAEVGAVGTNMFGKLG